MSSRPNVLTEAMQALGGLALAVDPTSLGKFVVLYDPTKLELPLSQFVCASAVCHALRDGQWIVGSILARHGYGPSLYAVAAQLAAEAGALVIPSDLRSPAAKATWLKFKLNPYVDVEALADVPGRNGPVNHSPTGFGIRGNGTLAIDAAIERDRAITADLGSKWRSKMLKTAYERMKRAVN